MNDEIAIITVLMVAGAVIAFVLLGLFIWATWKLTCDDELQQSDAFRRRIDDGIKRRKAAEK